MAEAFTAITTEIYINGAWADVSEDVLQNPAPRVSGMGIMGTGILDRVGDVGTFAFSLDNSTGNSGATLGYYSPAGANRRTGWGVGLQVRLSFTWDGYKRYKYHGTIDTDGITVVAGKYGQRRVDVRCSNWMRYAVEHTLDLIGYQINVRGDQAIQCVIDNMTHKPQKLTMSQGFNTYPTMFDMTRTNTKAIGEINKIVMSGLDYFFVRGGEDTGEEAVFMSRASWTAKFDFAVLPAKSSSFTDSILLETGGTDDILLETGDRLLLEHSINPDFNDGAYQDNMLSMDASFGQYVANHTKMVTHPRVVDAAAVTLYALETPITILAAETLTDIRGEYSDPNSGISKVGGIEMVTPVATTDYQMFANSDGTGTDRTADLVVVAKYGTAEVEYTLTNNNAATSYITKLTARGKGVYVYDESTKVYDSPASIAAYDVKPLDIDMPYLSGVTELFDIADKVEGDIYNTGILSTMDDPDLHVERVTWMVNKDAALMAAFMFMEPSDCLTLYETVSNHTDAWTAVWHLIGYDFEITAGKYVKWSPVLKKVGMT